MKAYFIYIGLSVALILAGLFVHALPAARQGAALMALLLCIALCFVVTISRR